MTIVLICIGAAKAGTDWLHRQLLQHPQCHLRAIKELHYFDALEGQALTRELDKHRVFQQELLTRLAQDGQKPNGVQARRLADRAAWLDVLERGAEDIPGYIDYLTNGAEQGQVVADMTPAYALLPEARLSSMATMASDVRFLYLLRDPIERLWSHVRMIAVRRDPEQKVRRERCARILQRTFDGKEDQISNRSDYRATLSRLRKAVPAAQVLVEAFEDMLRGDGFDRICRFLGISSMVADAQPVHTGQPLDMTRDQRRAAALWLAPQYEAAEQALGRLPEGWAREG